MGYHWNTFEGKQHSKNLRHILILNQMHDTKKE